MATFKEILEGFLIEFRRSNNLKEEELKFNVKRDSRELELRLLAKDNTQAPQARPKDESPRKFLDAKIRVSPSDIVPKRVSPLDIERATPLPSPSFAKRVVEKAETLGLIVDRARRTNGVHIERVEPQRENPED